MTRARYVAAMAVAIVAGALLPAVGNGSSWLFGDWPVFVPTSIVGGFLMRTWWSLLVLPVAYTVGFGLGGVLVEGIVEMVALFIGGAVFVFVFFFIPHLFTMLLPISTGVIVGKVLETRLAGSSVHRIG